jgi:hypothetical protein
MLDRLDLRVIGPPLYGSRVDRNLLPLEQVAGIDCCSFKCASLLDPGPALTISKRITIIII